MEATNTLLPGKDYLCNRETERCHEGLEPPHRPPDSSTL